jgi:hypothetical protein
LEDLSSAGRLGGPKCNTFYQKCKPTEFENLSRAGRLGRPKYEFVVQYDTLRTRDFRTSRALGDSHEKKSRPPSKMANDNRGS